MPGKTLATRCTRLKRVAGHLALPTATAIPPTTPSCCWAAVRLLRRCAFLPGIERRCARHRLSGAGRQPDARPRDLRLQTRRPAVLSTDGTQLRRWDASVQSWREQACTIVPPRRPEGGSESFFPGDQQRRAKYEKVCDGVACRRRVKTGRLLGSRRTRAGRRVAAVASRPSCTPTRGRWEHRPMGRCRSRQRRHHQQPTVLDQGVADELLALLGVGSADEVGEVCCGGCGDGCLAGASVEASRTGVSSCRAPPTALAGEPSREVRARVWVFQRWRRTVTSSRSDSDRGPRRRMRCRARLRCRLVGGWSRRYCSTAASRSAKARVSMPVGVGGAASPGPGPRAGCGPGSAAPAAVPAARVAGCRSTCRASRGRSAAGPP